MVISLGDVTSDITKGAQVGVSTAGSIWAGSIASTLSLTIPIVGAAVAGLTFAIPYIVNAFRGCGPTCEMASKIVDEVEQYLGQNLNAYLNGPRTYESQITALNTFDQLWQAVLDGCGNPNLGEAGRRCISERQRGGHVPGVSREGSWFEWYRDPIANDPDVKPPSIKEKVDVMFPELVQMGISPTMLIFGGLVLLGLIVVVKD